MVLLNDSRMPHQVEFQAFMTTEESVEEDLKQLYKEVAQRLIVFATENFFRVIYCGNSEPIELISIGANQSIKKSSPMHYYYYYYWC